MAILETIYLFA